MYMKRYFLNTEPKMRIWSKRGVFLTTELMNDKTVEIVLLLKLLKDNKKNVKRTSQCEGNCSRIMSKKKQLKARKIRLKVRNKIKYISNNKLMVL